MTDRRFTAVVIVLALLYVGSCTAVLSYIAHHSTRP